MSFTYNCYVIGKQVRVAGTRSLLMFVFIALGNLRTYYVNDNLNSVTYETRAAARTKAQFEEKNNKVRQVLHAMRSSAH